MFTSSVFTRRFLPYLLQWKVRIIGVFVIIALSKFCTVAAPVVLKYVVDALQMSTVQDIVYESVLWLIGGYFLFRVGSVVLNEVQGYVFAPVETGIVRMAANDVFNHVQYLSHSFHLNKKMGSLSSKIGRGVGSMEMVFRFMLFNIVPTILEILGVLIVLLMTYSFQFTLVVVLTMAAYVWFTIVVSEKRNTINKELNKKMNEADARAIDAFLNFETVKFFTNEDIEKHRYDDARKEVEDTSLKFKHSLYFLNIGQGLIISIGMVLLICFTSYFVLGKTMTIGDFTLLTMYLASIYTPLSFFGFVYRQIKEGITNIEDLMSVLEEKKDIQDAPNACAKEEFHDCIEFQNISFHYEENRPIIKDVSFVVPKGKTVALVGPSGSGKSSLAKLLFRFYETSTGSILLDSIPTKSILVKDLRKLIGFVPQDTIMFNETIRYNIAYGKPDATQEEVETAAKQANVHDFISSLPDGYETKVGERGLRLSGGEKQRVAIARVILKGAPILVFDEATSSLDSQSENIIQESIRALSKEKTMLIIAHRLSTIVDADEIIVLNQGEIVERGTHKDLIQQKGLYEELWTLQSKEHQE